jgi:hypothetical protein
MCVSVYMAFSDITFLQKYRLIIIQRLVAIVFLQVPNARASAAPGSGSAADAGGRRLDALDTY